VRQQAGEPEPVDVEKTKEMEGEMGRNLHDSRRLRHAVPSLVHHGLLDQASTSMVTTD
jgi:hypothetical protein